MQEKKKEDKSSILFVGCIIIGVGLGFLFKNILVGSLLGVGIGFVAKYFTDRKG